MAAARDAVEAQLELLQVQWVVVALALYCLGVTLGKTQPKCAVDPLPAMPTEEPARKTEAVARALPDTEHATSKASSLGDGLFFCETNPIAADPHYTPQACTFEGHLAETVATSRC